MPCRLPRSAALAVTLAACAPSGAPPPDTVSITPALRALRAATVGDRRFASARDPATPSIPGRPVARARRPIVAPPAAAPFDTTEWPSVVIPFTTTMAAPRTLWVGDTVALVAPTPPAGTPGTIARDLRWTSMEPAAATVSPAGEVVARGSGTANVVAWRRVGETVTPVTVLPSVRGRVATADGASVRARVVVRAASWTDTATTDPGGAFALRPTRPLDGTATVRVEPLDDGAHAPALLADSPVARLADLDVVLLPTQWRLAAGSYAGRTVSIRPAIAQGVVRDGLRFWHVSRPGRGDARDAGRAVGWSAARLPLAVAFDVGGVVIGAADSAAFWAIARQLERDWGAPLFRAAPRATGDAPDFRGIVVAVDPRIATAGLTTTGWDGDGDVSGAMVAVRTRSLLGDPRVVTHELLHALGIGHAGSGWTSVMHPSADLASGGRASVEDVAYGQLLYAVRARALGRGTPVGIAEAAAAAPER